MATAPTTCPCFSGQRYKACCAPLHRGERVADTPEVLMRSRFAAFALGLGPYLVRTLARSHADLALPREALERELSRTRERQRFLGLEIVFTSVSGDRGEVLFYARIFEKGADRSFVELSQFVREDAVWGYASGILAQKSELPPDLREPDREAPGSTFGLRTRAWLLGSGAQ
jgi:SEC-C motif domain protein